MPDRPKLLLPRQMPHSAPVAVPEKSERKRRLKDARQRAGRAQREWEAAVAEQAALLGSGDRNAGCAGSD